MYIIYLKYNSTLNYYYYKQYEENRSTNLEEKIKNYNV